ncbi:NAD-dependent epimerase/dehydratase family protein [Pseudomonas sp. RW10S2]|uniref:NAD-dependent epimerase/dehydratase family protein n=1 Tax=Pseudomonas sp. RW10S2 TaxID=459637 RepID=UPI001646976C|nr:NAD-dependent epimerase/dehydratase family protein [Pseudomonas sp. RW10S2]MBC3465567.1 NAD-dependent epimerase/dehydratase family protein [Pseudomonas sp. RW10S2]QXI44671.1 NAD-dependent epimerase/dehydratase family protein [Pseudomonas wayambapalatensis]
MRVLVLGGHGFIGANASRALLEAGHEVVTYARRSNGRVPGTRWIEADFNDAVALSAALEGIDAVVHSISATVPSSSALDPMADINQNLIATVTLLQAMQRSGTRKLVFLSSGGTVYGNPQYTPVTEQHALDPISNYGAVKVAIEKFIGVARAAWGLQAVILRPSNPFGVLQDISKGQGFISTVLGNLLEQKTTQIFGDGSVVRDYVYVTDLARLVVRAVEAQVDGVFNAGSGCGHSINQVIDAVQNITGRSVPVHRLPARGFDVREIVLDCTAAGEAFDWKPVISLERGIAMQYAWLKTQY